MTEKTRQTVKHIDRETWRSEDLGGAERMCERPSLDEGLDLKREATNLIFLSKKLFSVLRK